MAEFNAETWFDESVATFGDRLEAARQAAGLSQDDLAQRLGVRDTTVRAWEADEWEPRGNRLQMMAGMLNVSLMWLITGRGPGLAEPATTAALPERAQIALAEVSQLRLQMQELSRQMLRAEQKLMLEMKEMAS